MDNIFIDASFVGHRSLTSFCNALGYQGAENWVSTGTIFSFLRDLLTLLDNYGTDVCYAVIWDCPPTERKNLDPNYKAHRHRDFRSESYKNYALMHRQLAELRVLLPWVGFSQFECPGNEADDVLATLASIANSDGEETLLVQRDKDLYQCITPRVSLYDFQTLKNYDWFASEYGIEPEQWVDVQALAGDPTDNVPGIAGVGIKTAIKLLRSYGDFEGVLGSSDIVVNKSMAKELRLSRKLVELKTQLLLDFVPAQPDMRQLRRALKRKKMSKILSQSSVFGKVQSYRLDAFSVMRVPDEF